MARGYGIRYKIINHRTEDDAPAWCWYLFAGHESEMPERPDMFLCEANTRFGTRAAAFRNMQRVVTVIQSHSTHEGKADGLRNFWRKEDDPYREE